MKEITIFRILPCKISELKERTIVYQNPEILKETETEITIKDKQSNKEITLQKGTITIEKEE